MKNLQNAPPMSGRWWPSQSGAPPSSAKYASMTDRRGLILQDLRQKRANVLAKLGHSDDSVWNDTLAAAFQSNPATFALLLEFQHAQQNMPAGVYILPSYDTLFDWHGIVFITHGWYNRGAFKFKFKIPESYPSEAPRVVFTPPIFHPLVDPETGEVDISISFPKWTPGEDYLTLVLFFIKLLFLKPKLFVTANPRNTDASQWFLEDHVRFNEAARESVENSVMAREDKPKALLAPSILNLTPAARNSNHVALLGDVLQTCSAKRSIENMDDRKTLFKDWFMKRYGAPKEASPLSPNPSPPKFTPLGINGEESHRSMVGSWSTDSTPRLPFGAFALGSRGRELIQPPTGRPSSVPPLSLSILKHD
eukprot:Platyproteum_vivax@DN4426_c0_g1_i2.p1